MMNENQKTSYCKKCGCELMSTNKKKMCENCRRNRNNNIKNLGLGIAGTLSAIGVIVFTNKNNDKFKKK